MAGAAEETMAGIMAGNMAGASRSGATQPVRPRQISGRAKAIRAILKMVENRCRDSCFAQLPTYWAVIVSNFLVLPTDGLLFRLYTSLPTIWRDWVL